MYRECWLLQIAPEAMSFLQGGVEGKPLLLRCLQLQIRQMLGRPTPFVSYLSLRGHFAQDFAEGRFLAALPCYAPRHARLWIDAWISCNGVGRRDIPSSNHNQSRLDLL